MSRKSHENLKIIRFEGEMLPHWAALLDLAARISPVSDETRRWFSRFTNSSGVDDARTVKDQCEQLQGCIEPRKQSILAELQRSRGDTQAAQILGAWSYALDTIIQESRGRQTCSWIVEGPDDSDADEGGGGDITLRRV